MKDVTPEVAKLVKITEEKLKEMGYDTFVFIDSYGSDEEGSGWNALHITGSARKSSGETAYTEAHISKLSGELVVLLL